MWKKGLTYTEAIEFIRAKRGFIDPNLGFVGQLIELNKTFETICSSAKGSPFLAKV